MGAPAVQLTAPPARWAEWVRGLGNRVKRVGDGGVVGGGGGEGLLGEPPAGFAGKRAVVGFQFFDERGVIGDAGDDGDVFEVFGGGADHGGAADVDVFDEVSEGNAGLGAAVFSKA